MHPLVSQFNFACDEFDRSLAGLNDEDANTRLGQSNSIAWMIAHVANHAHFLWIRVAQDENIAPELYEFVKAPDEKRSLSELLATWAEVRQVSTNFLLQVTDDMLDHHMMFRGKELPESVGTCLLRIIGHVWYHNGEVQVVRQQLGHTDLPQFVGDLSGVLYR